MAVIFIASSFPSANLPRFGFWDVVVKKGGHLTGYALLAVAYLRALSNGGPISTRRAILAVGLAGLYAASDEFHQSFVPGRGAAAADVMIDATGAVLGVGARMWVRRWMGV
jgi:VanZ family protein